jgi:hypothetical protein
MRRELFQPSADGEGRLLLLIDAFTGPQKSLEGRTKLAKLDFFLRNPGYLARILQADASDISTADIESGMVRYRYGPWDPAYFALLGALVGRGLIAVVPISQGYGYRTTTAGHGLAAAIGGDDSWQEIRERTRLLRRYLDLSGASLKRLVYQNFPEVAQARWGDAI